MRTDKYMMAKAWMKQDQAPQSEARETWNTLETEFNEERKAMLMASAETDKLKNMINKKFGPGSMKYGSEIPQPDPREDVIQIDAINRFMKANPLAEGGRIGFDKGGDFRTALKNLIKNKDTSFNTMQQIFDKIDTTRTSNLEKIFREEFKNKFKFDNSPSKKLNSEELKIVLEWGKNKGKGKWSKKKILEAYENSSLSTRWRIREKEDRGIGGGNIKGSVKALTTEQQKLWDATMADEFGKWEDYNPILNDDGSVKTNRRGNWIADYPRKKEIFNKTKGLLTEDELAEYLSKKLGKDISKTKIYGRFGQGERTALATYIDDNLYVDKFGSIKGGKGDINVGGILRYFKKPTDTQINQIKKQNLAGDIRVNTLQPKTYDNIVNLHSKFKDLYYQGKVPDIKEVLAEFPNMGRQEAGTATSKLSQIYNGHKFRNNPPGIRVNKIAAKKMQETLEKFPFGHPYRAGMYNSALQTIDEGLGQDIGTFDNLKKKARTILSDNGIEVYYSGDKNPSGFNIDEFAGVTGTAKTKNMGVSQFINIMEGGLNQKTLANFQGQLSKARVAVEAAKGTPRYNKVLKEQMEKVNTRAANLEAEHGIKLARLERPADIKNMSADEVKRLKNIKLGTGENLYDRLVKDTKVSGYSVKIPEGSLTIQEFTDPNNARARELIALVGCPDFKGKQAFAEGGRTGFAEGGDCFDKGQKLINNGMKGASPASMRNAAKFLNSAYKFGRNVMKFGIIPEAIFVTGETLLRSLGDQTLEEGLKSSIGFYTDWTGLTDFKKDARISQNMRNMGVDAAMNIERLVDFNDATTKVNKLKENQKQNIAVWDEDLMGYSEQEYKQKSDANIAAAQKDLNNKFLKESEKLYFSQQQNEAADTAGSRSGWKKFLGEARNISENRRYENDFSGMQSDMFTIDPMSAKAKKDRVKNLPPQSPLTGSKGETAFLNLSQLPMGPRMGSEIDALAKASNLNFKLQGSKKRTNAAQLKAIQDYKQNWKDMTMEEMLALGIPAEVIYGFNQPEVIERKGPGYMTNYKPLNRFGSQKRPVLYPKGRGTLAEGGITALRSKYEYKK